MSALLIILLIVVLLYTGERLAIVGKGLGEGVKAFRKTVRQDAQGAPPRRISVEAVPPKLLPAKGESSASGGGDDHERH